MTPSLLRLLEATSTLLGENDNYTQPYSDPMRLDQLLEIREPLEHRGNFSIILDHVINRLLAPRTIKLVKHRISRLNHKLVTIGIDSSSRSIDLSHGSLIIGAATLTIGSTHTIEYPSLSSTELNLQGPGFLIPLLPHEIPSANNPIIITKNPAGYNYNAAYSIEQAQDELRLLLENWLLDKVAPTIIEELADRIDIQPVVLVDGPVYPLTMAHEKYHEYKNEYTESWQQLLITRLQAIHRLEAKGVPVIGVVKRLEHSLILDRVVKGSPRLSQCFRKGGEYSDQKILAHYYTHCTRIVPGSIYSSPKITFLYSKKTNQPYVKILEYTAIPAGKWQHSLVPRTYRLEYTESTSNILGELKLSAYHILAYDSVLRGSTTPVSIHVSDYRSKHISRAIHDYLASRIVESGGSLSYDNLLEAEASWRKTRRISAHY
ncbi:MAG: DNA double-strand break repair nuclease NurA [Desulfurococcales archaeon]|nr:DNA double-strand break repair nuclease NurA [Desulfurococcales archaeon]MEB3788724.1 DNA double-strand break repair nuclease NurA [Desulfurococcales archaeon]